MLKRNQLVLGNKSLKDVTDDICEPIERIPSKEWMGLFLTAKGLLYSIF